MPLYRYVKHADSVSDTSKQEFFARDFTSFQIKTVAYRMIFVCKCDVVFELIYTSRVLSSVSIHPTRRGENIMSRVSIKKIYFGKQRVPEFF